MAHEKSTTTSTGSSEGSKRKEADELHKDLVNVGGSVVGALVGLAIAGPVGAVAGATTSPALSLTFNVAMAAYRRRFKRAEKVVNDALVLANISPEEAIRKLEEQDEQADDFLSLLRIVVDSDPSVDGVLSSILGESLKSKTDLKRDRIFLVADSIRSLRWAHMQILRLLNESGGILSAAALSESLSIPEVELRHAVRELELRGMIKDIGGHPMEWKIRELGQMLAQLASKNKAAND